LFLGGQTGVAGRIGSWWGGLVERAGGKGWWGGLVGQASVPAILFLLVPKLRFLFSFPISSLGT
jgi:hypothetical protein